MNALKISKLLGRKYCTKTTESRPVLEKILCVYIAGIVINSVYVGVKNGSLALDEKKTSETVLYATVGGMLNGCCYAAYAPLLIPIYSYHYLMKE